VELVTIDQEASERVKAARLLAENPSNWRLGAGEIPEEGYVVQLEPRCQVVYTVDVSEERPWKHLSVSAWNEEGELIEIPRFLLFIIAHLFGLTLAEGNSFVTADKSNPMVIHALEPFNLGKTIEA